MKFKEGVNLEVAFDFLKRSLKENKEMPFETPKDAINNWAHLTGAVSAVLYHVEDKDGENTPDDIPEGLFQKPGVHGYNPD